MCSFFACDHIVFIHVDQLLHIFMSYLLFIYRHHRLLLIQPKLIAQCCKQFAHTENILGYSSKVQEEFFHMYLAVHPHYNKSLSTVADSNKRNMESEVTSFKLSSTLTSNWKGRKRRSILTMKFPTSRIDAAIPEKQNPRASWRGSGRSAAQSPGTVWKKLGSNVWKCFESLGARPP